MQINTHPKEVSSLFCPRAASPLYCFVRYRQGGRNLRKQPACNSRAVPMLRSARQRRPLGIEVIFGV